MQKVGNRNDMEEYVAAEDSLLVARIGQGNREAFGVLCRKHWKFVYNAAYKRLGNTDYAKDITQDVFVELWGHLLSRPADSPIENLRAYLYIAARNHVFKWMEKERRYVSVDELLHELDSLRASADNQLLYDELYAAYEAVLNAMPKQQQTIFRMRYQADLSSDEIADQLNLSPKTVRNQLGRALTKIRALLTPA